MEYLLGFIYIVIGTVTFLLLRKWKRLRHWSKKKVQFLYGLSNGIILFLILYTVDILFQLPSLDLAIIFWNALFFCLIMLFISFFTYKNEKQEKKNIFDEDFVPKSDIWILKQDKDFWVMQVIAVILVVLPLVAVFIVVYFFI